MLIGRAIEADLIKGLDRWLEKLNGRPDLLRKALALLSHYQDAVQADGEDQALAGDLIVQNTADDPLAVMEVYLSDQPWWPGRNDPNVRTETQWMTLAWLVPWERERQDRILRVLFWGDKIQRQEVSPPWHWVGPLPQLNFAPTRPVQPIQLCRERAMLLKLALRWYQADNGKPADNLGELVPKYLPSIPRDPYDGQPFRYRLSKGEEIEWPEPPAAAGVPAAPPAAPGGAAAPAAPAAPRRRPRPAEPRRRR